MRRPAVVALLLAAVTLPMAVATALMAAPARAAAPTQVTMAGFAFAPSSLSVTAGTTVQWTNHDTAPHDVTVTSGPFAIHSPMLSKGQSWSYTFSVAGTYDYICSIHPDMHAVLVVHAAAPPPTRPAVQPSTATVAQPDAAPLALSTHAGAVTPQAAPTVTGSQPPPAVTTTVTVAAAAAAPSTVRQLKPLLIVAGVVAAVATFCLLLLASSRDTGARN